MKDAELMRLECAAKWDRLLFNLHNDYIRDTDAKYGAGTCARFGVQVPMFAEAIAVISESKLTSYKGHAA